MKILYHHRTQAMDVEGVHIQEAVKAFRALGHAVDLISPPGVSVSDGLAQHADGTRPVTRSAWVTVSRWVPELCFELLELAYTAYAWWRLGRCLRTQHYDLVYERYAIFNWAGLAQARRHGVPFVLEVNHTSETPLPRKKTRWLQGIARRIDRRLFTEATELVVVSQELKRQMVEEFGVAPRKVLVLTNAADPQRFDPAHTNGRIRAQFRTGTVPVVGFVGRFLPWHGLDLLVQSMPKILEAVGETRFLFVGDGPQRPEIEAQVRRLGLERHVTFVGQVEHAELPEYLAAFDVAVLPDSNHYGSPMKIYEYMAMGKPTVAPRLGPVEEALTHEREGLLFEPKSVEALTQALIRVLKDTTLRERLGAQARKKIVEDRNWQRNAQAIVALATGTSAS